MDSKAEQKQPRYEPNPLIESLLQKLWYDYKEQNPKAKNPEASTVLRLAELELSKLKKEKPEQYENVRLPGLRKAQMILKDVRDRHKNLPDHVREYIDNTSKWWNFASLKDYPIPHEALPVVMKVSRLCRISEQAFTVRHALWTARLSTAISDTQQLAHWADVYAHRELKCLMTGQPLWTGDIDSMWSMGAWELATAYLVDEAPDLHWDYFVKSQELYPLPHYTGSGAIEVDMPYLHEVTERLEYTFLKGSEEAGVEKPQPIEQLNLSYTAERVYGMWLRYMSKGVKADELSQSECMELLVRLREWVKSHKLVKDPDYKLKSVGNLSNWLTLTIIMPISEIVEDFGLAPTELLHAVGYDRDQWESFSTYLRKTKRGVTNEQT